MAPERALERFAYVVIDKANGSRGTTVGNVLLCIQNRKLSPTDRVNTVGDFEVWDTADQVKARVGEIKTAEASGGGVLGVPSPTGKEGFVKSIDNLKRSELHHLTANWEGLLAAAAPLLSPNPLIWKSFEMPFAVRSPMARRPTKNLQVHRQLSGSSVRTSTLQLVTPRPSTRHSTYPRL